MDKVGQFESAFRSAAKAVFHFEPPPLDRVLVVTDLDSDAAAAYADKIRGFLAVLGTDWQLDIVSGGEFSQIDALLQLVRDRDPSLVVTYRHLHSDTWQWPHTLGEYVDVLTQVARCPVLVVPHPRRSDAIGNWHENTDVVMAMTDHLTGDDALVNWAARLTIDGGYLLLTHVEDELSFRHYLDTIAKIPEIDTETAREKLEGQLLKEPRDFVDSCRTALEVARPSLHVSGVVSLGDHLDAYMRLVQEHRADILVMNTKDDDQLAMHGLAYPIAIELRAIPILML